MNATTGPSARVLPAVWKLTRMRLRISWNTFRHAKPVRKIFTIIAYLGILGFMGGIVIVSWLLLGFLRSPSLAQAAGINPEPILQAIPVVIFSAMFLGTLLTSFGVLLQALYLSRDMDFLLASPVPIRAVFISKLMQAVLPNFGLLALFGLPLLFGLGFAGGYNFLYYPLVVLVMIVMALAGAGVSSLLVMLVVRVLPPRRAAEILGFIGGTLGLICGQMGNLSNAFRDEMNVSGTQATGIFNFILKVNTPWFPLNWAGRGLVDIGQGRWLTGLLFVTLTLAFAAAIFGFALVTAERWFYSGWAGMQVVAQKKKAVRSVRRPQEERKASFLQRILPAPVWGLLWKDFLVLRRDLRNLSQLISPLILGVIYTLMIFRLGGKAPAGQGQAPDAFMETFSGLLGYSSVFMSLFVGWMLLSRLAGMAFSSEGRNYWILKAAPLRTAHLLAAKFLVAYIPAFALGLLFLAAIAIMQKMTAGTFLYSLLTIIMCMGGMTGILLAFGVSGAKLDWDDPRKMSGGGMGCLGQFLTMLYLPVAFGFFIGPLWLAEFFHFQPAIGYLAGAGLGIVVTGLCASLPLLLVRKRLERLGEG
jgi:ABC-2 type transport system permease protein